MPAKKKQSAQRKQRNVSRNVPLDIIDNPIPEKVAQEIIIDNKPLQVASQKQSNHFTETKHLDPFKFAPGQSGNPSGRPKDPLKGLGLRIAQLKAGKVLKPKELKYIQDLGLDTADITMIEAVMIQLATSKNPAKIEMYLQRTFGNVPNININAKVSEAIVSRFRSKFTDSELERIAGGEDAADILFDKLPDVEGSETDYIEAESQSVDDNG